MLEILKEIIGVTGYDYIIIWVAVLIIAISIYSLFKVLLTILLRVGGYE